MNLVDPFGLTICDQNGDNCYESVTVSAGDVPGCATWTSVGGAGGLTCLSQPWLTVNSGCTWYQTVCHNIGSDTGGGGGNSNPANNGTRLEQWQQYQSQKHCYSGGSLTDKTVGFFSLLRLPETWKEWVVGGGTKVSFFGLAEAGAKSAGGTESMGAAALSTGAKILGTAGSAATGVATMTDFDCQIGPVEPYTQK